MVGSSSVTSKHNLKRSTRARYEVTLTVALGGFRDVAIADISRQMAGRWWLIW
jgi:hypothetical protein